MGLVVLAIPILGLLFLGRNPEDLNVSCLRASEVSAAELKSKEPRQLSLRKATSAKPFWLLFFLYMSLGFATFIPLAHIVAYGIDKGIPPITAANLLGAVGGAGVVGRVLIGTSSDRFGAMKLMPLMVILQAIAMASLVAANRTVTLFFFAVLFGFAYGACVPLFQVMIVDLFGTDHMGAIFGSLAFGGTTGGALGPLVAGYMFDLTGNYHSAFLLGACFAIVGLVFFIALSLSNGRQVRPQSFDQRGAKREPAPF
jgi:MFS family permease